MTVMKDLMKLIATVQRQKYTQASVSILHLRKDQNIVLIFISKLYIIIVGLLQNLYT